MKRLEAQFEDDGHARAGFDPHRTVVVREISHTEFDAVQAELASTERTSRP